MTSPPNFSYAWAERAGAIDEIGAAMDDEIGIGADERQLSRRERRQPLGVIGGGLVSSCSSPVQIT